MIEQHSDQPAPHGGWKLRRSFDPRPLAGENAPGAGGGDGEGARTSLRKDLGIPAFSFRLGGVYANSKSKYTIPPN